MTGEIRLNLGCGDEYRTSYINIDNQSEVVDLKADVLNLPFEPNSVDDIYASQLIEHFDHVHCKYLLSEWFISLKPKGKLVLETPDLKASYKKLRSADGEDRSKRLQWIYGIDSPGMRHGTGFTYPILKNMLQKVGFSDIKKKEQKTHTYEPGLRVVCSKPRRCRRSHTFALFRSQLLKRLELDSFFLIPMETWIEEMRDGLKERKDVDEIIAKSAICHPEIALAFLENFDKISDEDLNDQIQYMNYLKEIDLHKKIFSLWTKNRKSKKIQSDYDEFVENQKEILLNSLKEKEELSHLEHLDNYDTEIFDIKIILTEAKKKYNLGVKRFERKDFEKAYQYFKESVRLNPANPLTHWNLGRLKCILGKSRNPIEKEYESVLHSLQEGKVRQKAGREFERYKAQKRVPSRPVPWRPEVIDGKK